MPLIRVLPTEYITYTNIELLCNHFEAQGTPLYIDTGRGSWYVLW